MGCNETSRASLILHTSAYRQPSVCKVAGSLSLS
jgi:hypothetical protein